jgi:hypothetical protein
MHLLGARSGLLGPGGNHGAQGKNGQRAHGNPFQVETTRSIRQVYLRFTDRMHESCSPGVQQCRFWSGFSLLWKP